MLAKVSDANDFMPIAGRYGARVPTGRMSFEFLQASTLNRATLTGEDGWKKPEPVVPTEEARTVLRPLAIIMNNFCGVLQDHGVGDDFDTPAAAINELVRCKREASGYAAVMNEAMKFALGLPNFRCIGDAQRLRAAGVEIAYKAGAEQAAVIHWPLPFAIAGGGDWIERAVASLRCRRVALRSGYGACGGSDGTMSL